MDMRKHVGRFLSDDRLRLEFDGRYVGEIADVKMETVRDRFRAALVTQPTIHFTDGNKLIPNQHMRRELIALFGYETDDWRGRRVRVRRQAVEFTDRKTGEIKTRYEKHAEDPSDSRPTVPFAPGGEFSDVDAQEDDDA